MPSMVLLRHDLPDGSFHFDWMVERESPGSVPGPTSPEHAEMRVLATWRVGVRIDDPACLAFDAEPLGDHRRAYLNFEGELAGNRGLVTRVAQGDAEIEGASPRRVHVTGRFIGGGTVRTWIGIPDGTAGRWRFAVTAAPE